MWGSERMLFRDICTFNAHTPNIGKDFLIRGYLFPFGKCFEIFPALKLSHTFARYCFREGTTLSQELTFCFKSVAERFPGFLDWLWELFLKFQLSSPVKILLKIRLIGVISTSLPVMAIISSIVGSGFGFGRIAEDLTELTCLFSISKFLGQVIAK